MATRSVRNPATTLLIMIALAVVTPAASGESPDTGAIRFLSGEITAEDGTAAVQPGPDGYGVVLIRFRDSVSPAARRATLAAAGGNLGRPLPGRGSVARVPVAAVERLRAHPGVEFVAPYQPRIKISPAIATADPSRPWTVTLHDWVPASAGAAAIESIGISVLDRPTDAVLGATLRVDAATVPVTTLAEIHQVAWIEPEPVARLMNDRSRWVVQSNVEDSFSIHDHGLTGDGMVLAVMDSGLEKTHCCFGRKRVDSYDTWGGDNEEACASGHGTHVAGTAGCAEPGGAFDGVAPGVQFVIQDIQKGVLLACTLGTVTPPSDLRDAFADAYGLGARVHTNSWGGGSPTYGSAPFQIDDFVWNNPEFLILFAAGNSGGGANAGTISSQPAAKNHIVVGGTESAPRQDWMYGSSSKGPTRDGRRKPDLTAPATRPDGGGPSVTSADSSTSCGYIGYSGTSMATPAVAGSAILVRQYFEEGFWPTGQANPADALQPSAALVKATLIASADNMAGSDTHGDRPNNTQGWGRVNLDAALSFPGDPESLLVLSGTDVQDGFAASGEERVFDLHLPDQQGPFRVVLVWTDPPAAAGASEALINDLDLTVELRGGVVYSGGGSFVAGASIPHSGSPDRVNNTEAVLLDRGQAGNATVRVSAHGINATPGRNQDFALVVVGQGVTGSPCTGSPVTSVGGSLRVDRTAGDGVRLSWNDVAQDHYEVWREDSASALAQGALVYAENVQDADAGVAGIQWDDVAAVAPGGVTYYRVEAANACHENPAP